jgi:predicted amidohydrolase YtcJ
LLPGLHDHHLHLPALAASLNSARCGPPHVNTSDELAALLARHGESSGEEWLRGIGYHESVAGEIDRDWLDSHIAERPVRIQHRSGRLWIFNSAGLERLAPHDGAPLERKDGRLTGRLYDNDDWLRRRLAGQRPSLHEASRVLASRGVTSVTEVTPSNTHAEFIYYAAAQAREELLQNLLVMGDASLDAVCESPRLARGGTKLHLHESALPDFDDVCARVARSHEAGRPVAIHCVTEGELVFSLEALAAAGAFAGDRIEHASIAPAELLPRMRELGVIVVTQPNFVWERGDQYLQDVAPEELRSLYRARGLRDAGIAIAGGTDAPFGAPDPWRAMQAAVDRRTRGGAILGEAEALSPEDAYHLFTSPLREPGKRSDALAVGAVADLCLIDRPWRTARTALAETRVVATVRDGILIWHSS